MRLFTFLLSLFVVAIVMTIAVAVFILFFFTHCAVPQASPSGAHFTFDDSLTPGCAGELSEALNEQSSVSASA
jgi:hypothetical protein